ncbi:MAG: hypothetical protein AB1521_04865 [Bacteroidota bacterium]
MLPNRLIIKKVKQKISALILFLLIFTSHTNAQVQWGHEDLTRGKLWQTIWNSLQYGEPNNLFSSSFYTMDYPGYTKGSDAGDALNYCQATGYSIYGKRNDTPLAYTITTRFQPSGRYVYPLEEAALKKNYNFVNPTDKAEETVTGAHHVIDLNVDIAHKSMVWSLPGYSDFVIHEVTITNTHWTALSDIYFGMRYGIVMTLRSGTEYDEKYGWDENAKLFYFYDHRSFRWDDEAPIVYNFGVGPERGDIADARDIYEQGSREHELDAPGYFTAFCLDSKNAPVYQNILEHLGGNFATEAPVEDQMIRLDQLESLGANRLKEIMIHEQPHLSWDEAKANGQEGGNKFERKPEFLVSAGPYELEPYESITLVFAEAVGEMDRAKIVEGGVANIDLLATESKAALLEHVKTAKEFYANGYVPKAYPPMTVSGGENSLELSTEPGAVRIKWEPVPSTYTDPLTLQNDFAGYRVYRSTYFTIGPWKLAADIPKAEAQVDEFGKVYYVDSDLPYGVGNYYCVTTYDAEGNESAKLNNNRYPVYPLRGSNKEFPKNVYVVPNPFRQHSGLYGSGERYRMEFIGLPGKCRIKIFTAMGELVKEIHHDDGTGSTSWGSIKTLDYQLNNWMLGVAPGVYIYSVESLVPEHNGETFIGKFAIIK